ncbi:hypothetical protein AB4Z54_42420, partial [Streptomyces sp. MCAF7]
MTLYLLIPGVATLVAIAGGFLMWQSDRSEAAGAKTAQGPEPSDTGDTERTQSAETATLHG